MVMKSKAFMTGFFALSVVWATSSAAMAETEAAKMFEKRIIEVVEDVAISCKTEREKFCSMVTPGDGRLLHCALAHEDKLSQTCFNSLFDAVAELRGVVTNLQFAIEDCRGDAGKFCGDVKLGGGRLAQCLIDNQPKLSGACSSAVRAFKANNQ